MTTEPQTEITPPTPEPDPEPQAEKAKPERGEIEYVVLSRRTADDNAGEWKAIGTLKAKNPDAAIEEAIGDDLDPTPYEWVAVATRYWSPQRYEVKEETIRTLVRK